MKVSKKYKSAAAFSHRRPTAAHYVTIAAAMFALVSSVQAAQTGVTTSDVEVRESAAATSPVLTTLKKGTTVAILGEDAGGYRVQTEGGAQGVIASAYVEVAQATTTPSPTTSAPAAESDTAFEAIQVTGTRIRQANLLSSVPMQTVDSFQMELTGEINAGDIVRNMPVAGVSAITPTNSNFSVSQAGITTVDLRNLGEDRTLVLVNGRRFVAGVPGSQIVDFNSIPTDFIERIDVITGGASAVYGSDALAGVINIVLKKGYEGATLSGQTGQTFDQGDDVNHSLRLTAGSGFGEGRGHALFNASWSEAQGVFARDRELTQTDCFNLAFVTDNGADFQDCFTPTFSSFPPNTRIIIPNGANATGGIITANRVIDPTTGNVRAFSSVADGFNRQSIRALSIPLERSLMSSVLSYEFSRGANLFFEGTYAQTKSTSELEPFPLSSQDVFGGQLPNCRDTDGSGGLDTCDLTSGVPLSSGVVPQVLRNAVLAANPELTNNTAVVGFARRLSEVGNRGNTAIRETSRLVMGLDGDLLPETGGGFFSDLRYEVSYNHATMTDNQVSGGQLNAPNLRESFNTTVDPVTGEVICANPVARDEGCSPTFIFGRNTIGPDALGYIIAPVLRTVEIEQNIINGFYSGRFGQLPNGGAVGFSLGAEQRRESSRDIPDALTQTGQNAGNQIAPQVGSFDVNEVFAEVDLPFLQGQPFADYLSVKGAVRLSEYSTVGSTTAYSLGAEWAMNPWARFRGQYARAVRAPNIGELFSTGGETFATVNDPCAGVTTTGAGEPAFFNTRQDINNPNNVLNSGIDASSINSFDARNCMADPAIADRVAATGGLALTQPEIQGVGGFVGASPPPGTLTEETADSYTVGTVFTPHSGNRWVDAFSFSVDYYTITIDDAIAGVGRQLSLDECYSDSRLTFSPSNPFCLNVNRFQGGVQVGALDQVNGSLLNIAELKTAGIDFQFSYGLPLADVIPATDLGKVLFSVAYTRLLEHENIVFGQFTDDRGKVGFSDNKALINLLYTLGPATFNWETTMIGAADVDVFAVDDRAGKLPTTYFHDAQFRYALPAGMPGAVVVGVDNVFDEFVPVGGTNGDAGQAVGHRTYSDVYEPFGRAWYTGLRFDLK